MQTPKKQHSQKPLYGIIITFLLPILLAHGLFHMGYGKNHNISKGTLLTPPIIITKQSKTFWQIASLTTPEEHPQKHETLYKRWHALGKDQKRVHLTILADSTNLKNTNKNWENGLIPSTTMSVLKETKSKNKNNCTLFIIDPEGKAILCYDNTNELRDIDLDLRKLLKSSRI